MRQDVEDPRKRDRHSNRDRSDRRSTLHSEKKQRRSRSPFQRDKDREHRDYSSNYKSREKERDKEHDDLNRNHEDQTRDKDKERRKNGFPTRPKELHVLSKNYIKIF